MTNSALAADLRTIAKKAELTHWDGSVCDLAAERIERQDAHLEALTAHHAGEKRYWKDAAKELPAPFVSVLGYIPSEEPLPTVHECYYADVEKAWYSRQFYGRVKVTHWMPMPEFEEVVVHG